MPEVLRIVGSIAGIGGIALGILFYIYRDFLRTFIQSRVFRTLSANQATGLIGAIIFFTFAIATLGIFAGFVSSISALSFIYLVGVLLFFSLCVVLVLARHVRESDTLDLPAGKEVYFRVSKLLDADDTDRAERELLQSAQNQGNSADFWYWRSRIAMARGNPKVASSYIEEALKRQPRHVPSLALKIKLLILSGARSDRSEAKGLTEKSLGIDEKLDIWLGCLKAENVFSPGPRSSHELDAKCPYPEYDWDGD